MLIPLRTQRQRLVNEEINRQVNFAVQHHVIKIDIDEILCRFFVKFPFGTARQTFRNTRVTGVFVLHPVAGGHAVIPAAVPGQRVVLAIQTVGFIAIFRASVSVRVGVLGIARIQVTLAAVTRFQFQRLQWCEVPAHHAINIFVDHPFAPGW